MKTTDFDYCLPKELIAKKPIEPRDHSRLLILERESSRIRHKKFYDIVSYLHKDDVLVINNSKVFPARLLGQKAVTKGRVEILLEHEIKPGLWQVLGRGLDLNKRIIFSDSALQAVVTEKKDDGYRVLFNLSGEDFFTELEKIGHVPLPPYIIKKRRDANESGETISDRNDYQTVYANIRGSVAAPTAGLHFTPDLLKKIRSKGVKILEVTLHVGLGTFAPVKTDDILKHKMHSEYFSIKKEVVGEIIRAKKENRRIIAVGTTTTRVLESVFGDLDLLAKNNDICGQTDIFIYPGYKFKCVDELITNFHLPKSTLFMLVSAFAGKERIDKAYQEAIKQEYHFYSYGDAMLII